MTLYPINGGVNAVLAYLSKNPGAKTQAIATALGISERTLQRLLQKLKAAQSVEFRGAPKTGGYFIRSNDGYFLVRNLARFSLQPKLPWMRGAKITAWNL